MTLSSTPRPPARRLRVFGRALLFPLSAHPLPSARARRWQADEIRLPPIED